MKKTILKNLNFIALFGIVLLSAAAHAQGVNSAQIRSELDAQKGDIFGIIDIIMTCLGMAGVIYIAITFMSGRDQSKTIVVSWLLSLIIWGIAHAILD